MSQGHCSEVNATCVWLFADGIKKMHPDNVDNVVPNYLKIYHCGNY
jgi:hypothetical protein